MRRIPLTKGKFAIVDDDTFAALNKWKWYASEGHSGFYARRAIYGNLAKRQQIITMHRFIMKAKPGQLVDHINHNTLDNQRRNLRIVTCTQNNYNRKKRKTSRSQFKGLQWNGMRNEWKVFVGIDKHEKYIGTYKSELDAAIAYDEAAKQYHGEYAYLNFPTC